MCCPHRWLIGRACVPSEIDRPLLWVVTNHPATPATGFCRWLLLTALPPTTNCAPPSQEAQVIHGCLHTLLNSTFLLFSFWESASLKLEETEKQGWMFCPLSLMCRGSMRRGAEAVCVDTGKVRKAVWSKAQGLSPSIHGCTCIWTTYFE